MSIEEAIFKAFDARGNGGGGDTVNTITGDHQNRITDYTAIVVKGEEPYTSNKASYHNHFTNNGIADALVATDYKDPPTVQQNVVRRLTPLECERLQGMPDDWSRYGVDEDGNVYELSASARYKIQGNGVATPFWKWLLERISAELKRERGKDYVPTMASLFDGQGSFPMLWENINGKGTALWCSEIDKNASAVTRYHFPDLSN